MKVCNLQWEAGMDCMDMPCQCSFGDEYNVNVKNSDVEGDLTIKKFVVQVCYLAAILSRIGIDSLPLWE